MPHDAHDVPPLAAEEGDTMLIDEEAKAEARLRFDLATTGKREDELWAYLGECEKKTEAYQREAMIDCLVFEAVADKLLRSLGGINKARSHKWWKAFQNRAKPIEQRLHTLRLSVSTLPVPRQDEDGDDEGGAP